MKRIDAKNMPPRLPVISTITLYLLLDKLHAPDLVWGAVGVLFLIMWIGVAVSIWKSEYVDIFASKAPSEYVDIFARKAPPLP